MFNKTCVVCRNNTKIHFHRFFRKKGFIKNTPELTYVQSVYNFQKYQLSV